MIRSSFSDASCCSLAAVGSLRRPSPPSWAICSVRSPIFARWACCACSAACCTSSSSFVAAVTRWPLRVNMRRMAFFPNSSAAADTLSAPAREMSVPGSDTLRGSSALGSCATSPRMRSRPPNLPSTPWTSRMRWIFSPETPASRRTRAASRRGTPASTIFAIASTGSSTSPAYLARMSAAALAPFSPFAALPRPRTFSVSAPRRLRGSAAAPKISPTPLMPGPRASSNLRPENSPRPSPIFARCPVTAVSSDCRPPANALDGTDSSAPRACTGRDASTSEATPMPAPSTDFPADARRSRMRGSGCGSVGSAISTGADSARSNNSSSSASCAW